MDFFLANKKGQTVAVEPAASVHWQWSGFVDGDQAFALVQELDASVNVWLGGLGQQVLKSPAGQNRIVRRQSFAVEHNLSVFAFAPPIFSVQLCVHTGQELQHRFVLESQRHIHRTNVVVGNGAWQWVGVQSKQIVSLFQQVLLFLFFSAMT